MGRRSGPGSRLINLSERSALCHGGGGGGVNSPTGPGGVGSRSPLCQAGSWLQQGHEQSISARPRWAGRGTEAAGPSRTDLASLPHSRGGPREKAVSRAGVGSLRLVVGENLGLLGPFLLPQFLPQGNCENLDKRGGEGGKKSEAGGLRFGRESWAQAGIAPRELGRDGGP